MGSLGMKDLKRVFKGRKVLVTGDTGFKGSWLSLWLHALGAEVMGYALEPEENSHFILLKLDKIIRHTSADIRDLESLQRVFNKFKPEFLFHLAAQAIVRVSYKEPKYTFDTNVGGSVNILECVRNCPSLRSVIYVTSDKCYLNREVRKGYCENDSLGGFDPYSASKAAAEIVFSAYLNSFFRKIDNLGLASVRAGNVIGGGDWGKDRIIPDCIRYLKEDKPIVLRNPQAVRPWQHVLDPLCGYLILAHRLSVDPKKYSGSYNFGPGTNSIKTVRQLAEEAIFNFGRGKIKIKKNSGNSHESNLLYLNCRKAKQALDWKPQFNFSKAIFETVRWYKEVMGGRQALSMTKQQINEFMEAKDD